MCHRTSRKAVPFQNSCQTPYANSKGRRYLWADNWKNLWILMQNELKNSLDTLPASRHAHFCVSATWIPAQAGSPRIPSQKLAHEEEQAPSSYTRTLFSNLSLHSLGKSTWSLGTRIWLFKPVYLWEQHTTWWRWAHSGSLGAGCVHTMRKGL